MLKVLVDAFSACLSMSQLQALICFFPVVSCLGRHFSGGDSSDKVCFGLNVMVIFCLSLGATRMCLIQQRGRIHPGRFLFAEFTFWSRISYLSNHLCVVHTFGQEQLCFSVDVERPTLVLFPFFVLEEALTSSSVLSFSNPASG